MVVAPGRPRSGSTASVATSSTPTVNSTATTASDGPSLLDLPIPVVGASDGQVYRGPEKLIISIDVGATCSAVAYQHLIPGKTIHRPKNVETWPGAPVDYAVKTPSVIVYEGTRAVKFGDAAEDAELEPNQVLVKYFKLSLHPSWMRTLATAPLPPIAPGGPPVETIKVDPIPEALGATNVYRDMLNYLLAHTRSVFTARGVNSLANWKKLMQTAKFVIGAPNGWGPREKQVLIDALVASEFCHSRDNITVVPEAEASLLYLLNTTECVPVEEGALVTVCDAGGSTIDISLYRCVDAGRVRFEEVGSPLCAQKGGHYVSLALESYLLAQFSSSVKFRDDAARYARAATADFDHRFKRRWDGTLQAGEIKLRFASTFDAVDEAIRANNGKIAVPVTLVNNAFRACVDVIVGYLQIRLGNPDHAEEKSQAILLVGGFGDSPYLQRILRERFETAGPCIPILAPSSEQPGVKAVSAGGPWLFARRETVIARGLAFSYGVKTSIPYQEGNPEHASRRCVQTANGQRQVLNAFYRLITKGETSTTDDFRPSERFVFEAESLSALEHIYVKIFMYGGDDLPNFMDDRYRRPVEGFYEVGSVHADGRKLPVRAKERPDGRKLYELEFRIGVSFGGLRIRARIESPSNKAAGYPVEFKADSADFDQRGYGKPGHSAHPYKKPPPNKVRHLRLASSETTTDTTAASGSSMTPTRATGISRGPSRATYPGVYRDRARGRTSTTAVLDQSILDELVGSL